MPAPDFAAEIAQLEAGLASGEVRIDSDGDSVTYRGVGDIKQALAYFRQQAAANGRAGASSFAVFERD